MRRGERAPGVVRAKAISTTQGAPSEDYDIGPGVWTRLYPKWMWVFGGGPYAGMRGEVWVLLASQTPGASSHAMIARLIAALIEACDVGELAERASSGEV